jgi:protein-tyrosine phosphatase
MNTGGPLDVYDDELKVLREAGVRAVVSLLNIPSDAPVYKSAGFDFLCLPVPDGQPPTREQVYRFTSFMAEQRAAQRPVAVHCEGGLGRTGTMLAAYLISHGEGAGAAIRQIRAVEPSAIETAQQIQFLKQLADGCEM